MNFYTNVLQWGNQLFIRAVINGQRQNFKVRYRPTLFSPVQEETGYKTLDNISVLPIEFDNIKEAKEWVESHKSQPELVYGNTQFAYNYISDTYSGIVNWDLDKILMVTIDIEVQCENGFPSVKEAKEEMLSITVKNHQNKKIVVFGLGEFSTDRKDITYIHCESELHLLKEFLIFWEKHQPDIITGWNTEFFDIPYLCNRIKNVLGEDEIKRLSPWGSVFSKDVYKMGRQHQAYTIQGVAALDYFDLYRKFTYTTQESYRLDHIAKVELGEQKAGNPYDTFKDWYTKDYQSFIEYNIQDVEIVDKLEDKMKLIELCLTMAYDGKVNYIDVLGSVRYWDILIYNYLKEQNIVIPQKKHSEKPAQFTGAYVKDPQVGMHNWVMSFDLNSLYPHLIMQYNISPETLIPSDKEVPDDMVDKIIDGEITNKTDYCMAPNGAFFRKDKRGFLPELMETIYNDRVKYKKLMLEAKQEYENTKEPSLLKDISRYENIQLAKKISLNSAYGAIGNNWFRYFNLRNAEAITTSGQLAIRWIEKALNIYLNKIIGTENKDYVIASDTDSVYITFDALVRKSFKNGNPPTDSIVNFLDKIATNKIEPFIDVSYQALAKMVNAYDQKMVMKREVIADKGIWTAKKRYILSCWDIEGVRYKDPKLKMMGIEAVKSSTPAPCRDKIKGAMNIIMTGDEKMLNTFIQKFREEFMKLSPEEIAFPRSCNGIKKFTGESSLFAKGAPIHVKGAILYNHLIKKHKLENKYPYVLEGDKLKFINLKQPNIYTASAFSFPAEFPKELDILNVVDYDEQFNKSFVQPLNFITEKINWLIDSSYGTQGSLEDFFK